MNKIWLEGKHLMTVHYSDFKANLYALHNHFVEVYFSNDNNSILKIQAVDDDGLRKYLLHIHSYLF